MYITNGDVFASSDARVFDRNSLSNDSMMRWIHQAGFIFHCA